MRGGLDPRAQAWLELLREPCTSNLSPPCYAGTDGGYLLRTTDVYTIQHGGYTGLVVGTVRPNDAIVQWAPLNASPTTGLVVGTESSGGNIVNMANVGFPNNFICNNAITRSYRPVAACLKWIPDGPYSTRQGSVGKLSTPGVQFVAGVTYNATAGLAICQHVASNGSENHEVRWLPTNLDECYTTITASSTSGAGSVALVLRGTDATAINATTVTYNGRLEVITVWEWQPVATNSVSVTSRPPLPFTSQQVLSTIKDIGDFVYHGAMSSVRDGARLGGQLLLTAGYNAAVNRGRSQAIRG